MGLISVTVDEETVLSVRYGNETPTQGSLPLAEDACQQLEEYSAGARKDFNLSLRWPKGMPPVFRDVLSVTAFIPAGQTISYGEVARISGHPRAAGTALRQNPFIIVVPCHRVIHADGTLSLYGGREDKRQTLLDIDAL